MKKTQSDQGLKFDGAELMSQKRENKFRGNQWSGHSNDGRLVQMAQTPNRKGNDGSCHHSGYADAGRKPQSSVPDTHAKGAPGMPQYRGAGGTQVKKPGSPDRINAGAGPRKGNKQ